MGPNCRSAAVRTATVAQAIAGIALGLLLTGSRESAYAQNVNPDDRQSSMGRLAARAREEITRQRHAGPQPRAAWVPAASERGDDEHCIGEPRCGRGLRDNPASTQAELSIAIDASGMNVVIGFNDFRGFQSNPISVSGYMFSDDGGRTFTDGGQLPITTGTDVIGADVFPWVFGDPDVKYLGACTFVYSSILLKTFGSGLAQTMSVHRSTDCGKTWQGPYEVRPATNPNGLLDAGGNAADAADKEFIDVDPDSGRVMMTWTNFTPAAPGFVEIRSAFSDDGGLTWPAANGRVISAGPADGQGSIPRFARQSANVYAVWERFTSFLGRRIAFARSLDNGLTWQAPIDISFTFLTMDEVLGNDRVHNFPSLAVDRSGGPRDGTIYVTYANNNGGDGSDIVFQKSTDAGVSFSAPILINSRPGTDRAQWFPWVTVDETHGRVSVFFYDQGIADSGHLSEVTYTFSDDGGTTWRTPRPFTERPFKAGHGNDTSQPNLGDYNQAVAMGGRLWAAYALARRPPEGFADGQPTSASLSMPDPEVTVVSRLQHAIPHAPVNLRRVASAVSGRNAFADPGETISLSLSLRNYVTNPLNSHTVFYPVGFLNTSTPGVDVVRHVALYPSIAPGETRSNVSPFQLKLAPGFVAGTNIELELLVISLDGAAELRHTLFTGTPSPITLLTEDFESAAPGTLPSNWIAAHGAGANTVPWTTSNTFCGGSNGAFHQNANDGPPGGSPSRWERLFSPTFNVPADTEYVVVEFDVCYDTEDDPNFRVLAYDGFFLRVTDLTPGRVLRSVLAEAFEDEFTTGPIQHYPRHLPRSNDPNYFQDMSVWAGVSEGVTHVRLRLPGMQGSAAQLRFEYTQDGLFTCQDVRPGSECGVFVDNVVVKAVSSQRSR